MRRTYPDSGVLIHAFRGTGPVAAECLALLTDPDREFAASVFLVMETLAKAEYNKRGAEAEFYRAIFDTVVEWARVDDATLVEIARQECSRCGLNAMDSLHVASAYGTQCSEFVTAERRDRSIHRSTLVSVVHVTDATTQTI